MLSKSFFKHFTLVFFLWIVGVSNAQDTSGTPEYYLLQNNQLISLNNESGAQRSMTALSEAVPLASSLENTSIEVAGEQYFATTQAQVSVDQKTLYLLQTTLDKTNFISIPIDARLIMWDRVTNQQHVLYDEHGVIGFFASPDMSHVIVFYYSGEFANSRPQACLLEVKTGKCEPITFGDVPIGQTAYWISNTEVILGAASLHPLYLLDTTTRELDNLIIPEISGEGDWYLEALNVIPNTRTLVTSASLRRNALSSIPQFFVINVDTNSMQPLGYAAQDMSLVYGVSSATIVGSLSVSPDGDYLFYTSGGYGRLIELPTGREIFSSNKARVALWVDDHTILLQKQDTQLELLQVNVLTGETIVMATDEAASGLLLSPSNPCSMTSWGVC